MKIANTKGLSLLEIMIVLAILGIVGTIASYNFRQYKINADLRTMARELESDIAKTKQNAISRGVCYRMQIRLSSAGNNYTIERGDVGNCASVSSWAVITKSPASLGLEGSGLIIETSDYGTDPIDFETRGTISEGGDVVLENRRGSRATITNHITGKTNVTFNMR